MTLAASGTRLLVAAATTLLLAGCGGGDDGDSSSAAPKVDRSGYFTKAESEKINPALAVYDAAYSELDTKHAACSNTSMRLFNAGKDARVAVKCHLDQTGAVVEALEDVDAAFGEIDGTDFRAPCAKQLEQSTAFLTTYRAAWKTVQRDWERYADGGTVSDAAFQKHFDNAYEKSYAFPTKVVGDVSTDCYTAADQKAARSATKSKTSTSKQSSDA